MTSNKLIVANMAQKIIFHCEMSGQISDGHWENSSPNNHHIFWGDFKWDDIRISMNSQVGVKGYVSFRQKRNYNFSNKELTEIVGIRIRFKVALWMRFPEVFRPILEENHWAVPDALSLGPDSKIDFGDGKEIDRLIVWYTEKVGPIARKSMEYMLSDTWLNLDRTYSLEDYLNDCKGLQRAMKRDFTDAEPANINGLTTFNHEPHTEPAKPVEEHPSSTTWFGMLAGQAEGFGKFDLEHRGIWEEIAEAYTARDLFRAGWLLSTIRTDSSRLMYEWTMNKSNDLLNELKG
jgi:hypothetical protein